FSTRSTEASRATACRSRGAWDLLVAVATAAAARRNPMDLVLDLLVAQALMGAFDTIYHHELKAALPRCETAVLELRIHAVRSVLYAVLFASIAWCVPCGAWISALWVLVGVEVLLTLADFLVEDRTRLLPQSERVLHTLLAINGGAAFVLLAL